MAHGDEATRHDPPVDFQVQFFGEAREIADAIETQPSRAHAGFPSFSSSATATAARTKRELIEVYCAGLNVALDEVPLSLTTLERLAIAARLAESTRPALEAAARALSTCDGCSWIATPSCESARTIHCWRAASPRATSRPSFARRANRPGWSRSITPAAVP